MLASAAEHYRVMQHLAVLAVARVRRARTLAELATVITAFQLVAARQGAASVPAMLVEQDIDPTAVGTTSPSALAGRGSDGQPLGPLLSTVTAPDADTGALPRLVSSLIADTGRAAQAVTTAATPSASGYVRALTPPSCARCAILAGRVYRWSTGFLRHPGCDCIMQPGSDTRLAGHVYDPEQAFRAGQVRGLSQDDTKAIAAGADMGKVVNVRRKAAGLTIGGRVVERGGRPTPAGIFHLATDRADAIAMLRTSGYLT